MSQRSNTHAVRGRLCDQPNAADISDHQMVHLAIALFGSDAPTAVAYSALEAWSEGNQDEYRFWSRVFQRLRN